MARREFLDYVRQLRSEAAKAAEQAGREFQGAQRAFVAFDAVLRAAEARRLAQDLPLKIRPARHYRVERVGAA